MNLSLAIPLVLHELATLVWIGGMFFAHFALRPTIKQTLEPPARIQVALGVFRRFFPWVWIAIATLWLTGTWVALVAMQGKVGLHVILMTGIALLMTLIFVFLYVMPYRKMRIAVEYENWRWASAKFSNIRKLMAVNLMLGLLTTVIAVGGPMLIPGIEQMMSKAPAASATGTQRPAEQGR
jgi:uncharacterized membrane protein